MKILCQELPIINKTVFRLDIMCKLGVSVTIHWRTHLMLGQDKDGREVECVAMTGLLVTLQTSSIMYCAAATLIRFL